MSKKLIKIKNVNLYTAICENAQDCWQCKEALTDKNIPFSHLNYDVLQLPDVFKALSTWNFFDGTEYFKKKFDRLAIVHWESFYNDDEGPKINVVVGIDELEKSQLFENIKLIEK